MIEDLVEREDTIQAKAESASKQQFKDNETAKDIRKKAKVELLQNVVEPLVHFLREKAAADREIRQEKLRAKQQEQQSQQQTMKAMILQRQQMNTAVLNVVEKLLNK